MGRPHPSRVDASSFSRHVLARTPSSIFVLDASGAIVFANTSGAELAGRSVAELIGARFVDFVHPEDGGWVAELYARLAEAPPEAAPAWDPLRLRLAGPDGETIPVRVVGFSGFGDPEVAGVIVDVTPAHTEVFFGRVLRGITSGTSIDELLSLVTKMIAAPPLELDAAMLASDDAGRFCVTTATSRALARALEIEDGAPWKQCVHDPVHVAVEGLSGELGARLAHLGFSDAWYVAVRSVLGGSTYRIVALSRDARDRGPGIVERIRLAEELAGVVLVRSQSDDMLRHAALHDPLTRLPNRSGFSEGIRELDVGVTDVAVLYVDLDGFKAINDRHGHAAGDRVLEVIADRLRSATRPEDLIARVGGDEFVVVLAPDAVRPASEQGALAAERIVQLVGESIDLGGDTLVGVAASVGVAVASGDLGFDDMLADSDAAMYAAKRAGGNRYSTVE